MDLCLILVGLVAISVGASSRQDSTLPPYKDKTQALEVRVDDLLGRLTPEEKIGLIHGAHKFCTAGAPRLGIPPLWMSDGPHGVREEIALDSWDAAGRTDDASTAMPANICLAATWDPDLAFLGGKTIGEEALARNKNIMLGPGVNIMRTPLNGRNFEYLGEDPYLTSRMAVGFIEGEQSNGISSCVKHFVGNDQETQRNSIDVEMDDRTLHEIYLPPFKAAVKEAHVWSVMGAYNRFRGQYCCENDLLLKQILKHDWGFQGAVISDWGGAHDTPGAVNGGLDLEMGSYPAYDKYFLATPFLDGMKAGTFTHEQLDDKVRRVLRVMFASHCIDGHGVGSFNTPAHQQASRRVAEEGIVLLKNEGATLPLQLSKIKSIAVIGSNAEQKFAYGGQSSGIKALYEVTALEGLKKAVGDRASVVYSPGYAEPRRVRRRGAQPAANLDVATQREKLIEDAVSAAKNADLAIVIAGLNHEFDTEGSDRTDLKLPAGQDELIERVVEANPRTVVVMLSGSPVEMGSWLDRTPALLQMFYGGMEAGNALAEVLLGKVNPSGKLPCTFPKRLEDSPATALRAYPGKDGKEEYTEGLLVGYRWFDEKKIDPLFPFGFGLSYTRFKFSGLSAKARGPKVAVRFDLANTGPRDGAEVAELYVEPSQSALPRPIRELKAFKKVFLRKGEKKSVTMTLDEGSFSYYDPSQKAWVAEKGSYKLLVGGSSRDLALETQVRLAATIAKPD